MFCKAFLTCSTGRQTRKKRDRRVRSHSLAGMYQDLCTSCLSFSNWSFAQNRRRGNAHKPDRKTGRLVNTAQQGREILLSCPSFSNPVVDRVLSGAGNVSNLPFSSALTKPVCRMVRLFGGAHRNTHSLTEYVYVCCEATTLPYSKLQAGLN